jgi:hypothetical protein
LLLLLLWDGNENEDSGKDIYYSKKLCKCNLRVVVIGVVL